MSVVDLRPVTSDNWTELIKLKVRDDQKSFVASNLYSVAESHFGAEYNGHWDLYPFGLYEDDQPVGFMMYGLNYPHDPQAFIMRLMIDEHHQHRGLGRIAMQKTLDLLRADDKVCKIGISYEPENEVAKKLYASFGFVETGEIVDGESVAVLVL